MIKIRGPLKDIFAGIEWTFDRMAAFQAAYAGPIPAARSIC